MSARSIQRAQERELDRQQRRSRRRTKRAAAGAALGATVLFAPAAEAAETFTVTNLNDSGPGSLRQAVLDADADGDFDIVNFQNGLTGTITLTTGEIDIGQAIEIRGPGRGVISVSGNNASRIFNIHTDEYDPVIVSGLTMTAGNSDAAAANDSGGAVYVDDSGPVELNEVAITGNTAGDEEGGGIYVSGGGIEITDSSISNNTAEFGGGFGGLDDSDGYYGPIEFKNTTVTGNIASDSGGGIYFYQLYARALIQDSEISGNVSGNDGGGVFLDESDGPSSLEINRSKITNNTADDRGGGINFNDIDGQVQILETDISGNTANASDSNNADNGGGGIYLYGTSAPVSIRDSTVSNNSTEGNGGGLFLYDMEGAFRLHRTTVSGNRAGTDGTGEGGGIYLDRFDGAYSGHFSDVTVANNTAPTTGGFYRDDDDTAIIRNSIFADNANGDLGENEANAVADDERFDLDFSLVENPGTAETGVLTPASNLIGVDPQLGALTDNGGLTQTQAPAITSPVIDVGSSPFTKDQRGLGRPFDQPDVANSALNGADAADIGAVELQAQPPVPTGTCKGKPATVVLAGQGQTTVGTSGKDVIVGDNAKNKIQGGGGNDLICAGGGADNVKGGEGNDKILGGGGKDKLSGDGGKDKLFGEGGKDNLRGGAGKDKLKGGPGKDKEKQ